MKFGFLILIAVTLPYSAVALPQSPADRACVAELVARLLSDASYYVPYFVAPDRYERPDVLILSGSQNVVDRVNDIEAFKRDMLEERFLFESSEGRIGGHYHERRRIFFVGEGHHRLAAALEIAKETGDWRPFRRLLRHGLWQKTDRIPDLHHRLPVRSTWGNYLSWRSFLAPLTPRP